MYRVAVTSGCTQIIFIILSEVRIVDDEGTSRVITVYFCSSRRNDKNNLTVRRPSEKQTSVEFSRN